MGTDPGKDGKKIRYGNPFKPWGLGAGQNKASFRFYKKQFQELRDIEYTDADMDRIVTEIFKDALGLAKYNLVKGPQGPDYYMAGLLWNERSNAEPAAGDALARACAFCADEVVVEGNNGVGNEPGHKGTLYFRACSDCLARGPHVRDKDGTLEAWNRRVGDG